LHISQLILALRNSASIHLPLKDLVYCTVPESDTIDR